METRISARIGAGKRVIRNKFLGFDDPLVPGFVNFFGTLSRGYDIDRWEIKKVK